MQENSQLQYLAITSPESIYKLAWQLNTKFNLNLREKSSPDELFFYFADINQDFSVLLIDSRFLSSKKLKKADFIIVLNEADLSIKEITKLNNILLARDAKVILNNKDLKLLYYLSLL